MDGKRMPQVRICHELFHAVRQPGCIPRRKQQAVVAVLNQIGIAAVAAGNGGKAQAHALNQRQRRRLRPGRCIELYIQHGQQRRHILHKAAQYRRILESKLPDFLLQRFLHGAGAANQDFQGMAPIL